MRPRVVSSVRSVWSSSPYHTSTRRHGPRRDRGRSLTPGPRSRSRSGPFVLARQVFPTCTAHARSTPNYRTRRHADAFEHHRNQPNRPHHRRKHPPVVAIPAGLRPNDYFVVGIQNLTQRCTPVTGCRRPPAALPSAMRDGPRVSARTEGGPCRKRIPRRIDRVPVMPARLRRSHGVVRIAAVCSVDAQVNGRCRRTSRGIRARQGHRRRTGLSTMRCAWTNIPA